MNRYIINCVALWIKSFPNWIKCFSLQTSAADPTARRYFWDVIKRAKNAKQTVVFSTHDIKEGEALCHRIGMLIDGKFQCLGSPTHLKQKFGRGYKLIIKLVPGPAENQDYVSSLSRTVIEVFSPCSLRDRRRNVVQYVISDNEISWDFLFKSMEHIKLKYNDLASEIMHLLTYFVRNWIFTVPYAIMSLPQFIAGGGLCLQWNDFGRNLLGICTSSALWEKEGWAFRSLLSWYLIPKYYNA